MRALATACAAALAVAGCAAEGNGLVIVFDGADVAAGGRDIVTLELFVGRTGPDGRFVRDYDPARDLFEVSMAELPGYRLFLRADVVPTDLEAVAIVGYDGDPDAGGQALVFGVVVDPPFVANELHEVVMTFAPVVERGTANQTDRWIERWGAAPIEPVAAHACLEWGRGLASSSEGAIVRADDLDCDGTVPPLCDPMQTDRLLLEGDADVDGDGFAQWATSECAACLVQDEDDGHLIAVACDCDEADDTVHFGATEACDGVDSDCNGVLDGNFTGQFAIPCQTSTGGADCDMGVHTCTETDGVVDSACTNLPASHVSCVDLSACRTPRQCPIGGIGSPAAAIAYHCIQRVFGPGPDYCGTAPVTQFFPSLGVPTPARCSATLWGGNENGWKVVLVDGAGGGRDVAFTDVACDQLGFVVEVAPAANLSHTFFVLVLADTAGNPIAAVPIDLSNLNTDEACTANDSIVCTAPAPTT